VALYLAQKKQIAEDVNSVANDSLSLITAEYRGLTSEEMTLLRKEARNAGVFLRVVRNTLAKRAFAGTEYECAQPALSGPLLLAFSKEDPAAAARLFKSFAKEHNKLVVTSIAISGQLLEAKQLDAVASLPTRDQALSMLLSVLQAPTVKLVRTLAETYTKLARTVGQIRDKKQAGGA
jgi:large subunit ribosomal protein L10